jgi:hypothetical protein
MDRGNRGDRDGRPCQDNRGVTAGGHRATRPGGTAAPIAARSCGNLRRSTASQCADESHHDHKQYGQQSFHIYLRDRMVMFFTRIPVPILTPGLDSSTFSTENGFSTPYLSTDRAVANEMSAL